MKNGDLISRSALLESMNAVVFRNVPVEHQLYVQEACKAFESAVKDAPAVDAEPVRRGEWEPVTVSSGRDSWQCSICGRRARGKLENLPYCHCGAKMDGDNDA